MIRVRWLASARRNWVIYIEHRSLIVFRDPQSLPAGLGAIACKSHLTLDATNAATTQCALNVSVLVSDLLSR